MKGVQWTRLDLKGRTFGKWEVLNNTTHNTKSGNALYLCRCTCGTIKEMRGSHLLSGMSKSCGCNRKGQNQWAKLTLEERFWSQVNKDGPIVRPELGPCWVWKNLGNRYGAIKVDDKAQSAHRTAWFLETGQWPKPNALHKCDNGHCVRFSHLFEGTQQENVNDREAKGRGKRSKGEKHPMHKLTEKQVKNIRSLYAAGGKTYAALGVKYRVSLACIAAIVTKKTWQL